MALVGNLRDFGLAEFLYLVDRGYKTGKLTLATPGDQVELYFQNGKLVYATSYLQPEHIGETLVREGHLTPEQLLQVQRLQYSQEPKPPLSQILLQRQMATEEAVGKVVRAEVEEITYALFGWNDGDFRFEPEAGPPTEVVPIALSLENIIMEGTRRIDEWARIKDRIPSLDVVVRFSDQPQEKAKGVNLTPDEWRVFARINGVQSIRQIAQQTGLGDFEVARIIYGFLSAGLVQITRQAPPPPDSRNGRTVTGALSSPAAAPSGGGLGTSINSGRVNTVNTLNKMTAQATLQPTGMAPLRAVPAQPRPTKNLIRRLIDAIARR